jgi:hypothetical protein
MSDITSIDDFVFNMNNDGKITSSGFLVNSFLLNSGLPPMVTFNLNNQNGGNDNNKFSPIFENLAVPAGLYYINCPDNKKNNENDENNENMYKKHEVISDDIYDKLFEFIVNDTKKKKNTRKNLNKIINHKKTKKLKS